MTTTSCRDDDNMHFLPAQVGEKKIIMSNDLIIDEGFVVLNNYTKSVKGDDDNLIPRCSFASYSNALSIQLDAHREMLLNDCSLVFTARTKDDSDGYSTGSTFFLPCLMKPRCALEALAQRIFRAHVDTLRELIYDEGEKELLYDPERSGAEWWTLVLDTPSTTDAPDDDEKAGENNDDDDDDDEGDDEVGFHFDADYGLEEQLPNYMLHPRVATITYLCDIGVPTLILDKRSPPPMDIEKKSLNGNIRKSWLSHPVFGKHVAFDGRLLHGAPGEYFPSIMNKSSNVAEPKAKRLKVEGNACTSTSKLSGKRITFMVNVSECGNTNSPSLCLTFYLPTPLFLISFLRYG